MHTEIRRNIFTQEIHLLSPRAAIKQNLPQVHKQKYLSKTYWDVSSEKCKWCGFVAQSKPAWCHNTWCSFRAEYFFYYYLPLGNCLGKPDWNHLLFWQFHLVMLVAQKWTVPTNPKKTVSFEITGARLWGKLLWLWFGRAGHNFFLSKKCTGTSICFSSIYTY